MCSKENPFFFLDRCFQTLEYHGDRTFIAARVYKCVVAICFLEIHLENAHFTVVFAMQIVLSVECNPECIKPKC